MKKNEKAKNNKKEISDVLTGQIEVQLDKVELLARLLILSAGHGIVSLSSRDMISLADILMDTTTRQKKLIRGIEEVRPV